MRSRLAPRPGPADRRTARCSRNSRRPPTRCRGGTCPRGPAPSQRRARRRRSRSGDRAGRSAPFRRTGPRRELLQLGVQPAAGDAELRARLEDAHARGAHSGVEALGFLHQLLKNRVVEVAPPLVVPHRRPPDLLRLRLRRLQRVGGPAVEPRHHRALEVGPEHARGEKHGSEQDERARRRRPRLDGRHRFSRPGTLRLPDVLEARRDSSRPIP